MKKKKKKKKGDSCECEIITFMLSDKGKLLFVRFKFRTKYFI